MCIFNAWRSRWNWPYGLIALYRRQMLFCPSLSWTIICCINRFTSLCKDLFNLIEFLAEAFQCHVHHFQCLTVPVASSTGTVKHWKWCTWHRKASAKNSNKLNKSLHSEVNLLIQQNYATAGMISLGRLRSLDIANLGDSGNLWTVHLCSNYSVFIWRSSEIN